MLDDNKAKLKQRLQAVIAEFIASEGPAAGPEVGDDYHCQAEKALAERAQRLHAHVAQAHADESSLVAFATPERCLEGLKQARDDFVRFDKRMREALARFKKTRGALQLGKDPEADARLLQSFMLFIEGEGLLGRATSGVCAEYLKRYGSLFADGQAVAHAAHDAGARYEVARGALKQFRREMKAEQRHLSPKAEIIAFTTHMETVLPGFTEQEAEQAIRGRRPPGTGPLAGRVRQAREGLSNMLRRRKDGAGEQEDHAAWKEPEDWTPEADLPKAQKPPVAPSASGYTGASAPPRWVLEVVGAIILSGVSVAVGYGWNEMRQSRWRDDREPPARRTYEPITGEPPSIRAVPAAGTSSAPSYPPPVDGGSRYFLPLDRRPGPGISLIPDSGPSIRALPPGDRWSDRVGPQESDPRSHTGKTKF